MIGLTFPLAIVWANLTLVAVALVLTIAAARCGSLPSRWVFAAIAPVAAVYLVGYIWLLGDFPERTLSWSLTFRGVSLVAWPVAWWLPAIRSIARHRHERDADKMIRSAMADRERDRVEV